MANSSAPIPSTFYAARQHFEQNSQIQAFSPSSSSAAKSHTVGPPPHLRAGAMDYKQYARPPQHPQQQDRQIHHSQPQPTLPRSTPQYPSINLYQPTYSLPPQPQSQVPSQNQIQGRPQVRPRSYSTYGQYPGIAQATVTPAPYAQRTHSHPQVHTLPQVHNTQVNTSAPVNDLFLTQQQTSHKNTRPLTPSAPPAYPLHQPPHSLDLLGRPFGAFEAASSAKAAIASSYPSQDPQNEPLTRAPTVGSRRPLPQPGNNASQPRARPLSMPSQAFANYQSSAILPAHTVGHSPSLSLSSAVSQPPAKSTSPAPGLIPTSVLPVSGGSSPARRPLPSPSSSASPLLSSDPNFAGRIRGLTDVQHKHDQSAEKVKTSTSDNNTIAKLATHHRGFSTPAASVQSRVSENSTKGYSTSTLVSRANANDIQSRTLTSGQNEQHGASILSPKSSTCLPKKTYVPRSYVKSTNLHPSNTSGQAISQSAPGISRSLSDSEDEQVEESLILKPEENKDKGRTPSPQYGIRDLPKRSERLGSSNFSSPQKTTTMTVETPKIEPRSPQYGIRDLPARTKSVVDRRKAWERAEQGINESLKGHKNVESGSQTQSSSPSKLIISSRPSTTASFSPPSIPRPSPPIVTPSRSPQPQTPKQEQKLPMPAIRHPKPSHTERKLSWTLPNADLDKLTDERKGEQKTSMTFKLAAMSLAEENTSKYGGNVTEKVIRRASKPPETHVSAPRVASQQRPLSHANSKASSSSRDSSPQKPYPFSTPRRPVNMDLSLDDAPPPSLRRSPSPSSSLTSSIPAIRTPEDIPSVDQPNNANASLPSIPKINLPGDIEFDFKSGAIVNPPSQAPSIVVSPKPTSPRKVDIPIINVPGDDLGDDDTQPAGPLISVSTPEASTAASRAVMPVILSDLANSPSKPRGLPQAPKGPSASTISVNSGSGSNLRSRGGGLICGGCNESIIGRIVSAMGLRWHPQCFKCCVCGEHLEHVSSYEHEGKPYCHLDYHEVSIGPINQFFPCSSNHKPLFYTSASYLLLSATTVKRRLLMSDSSRSMILHWVNGLIMNSTSSVQSVVTLFLPLHQRNKGGLVERMGSISRVMGPLISLWMRMGKRLDSRYIVVTLIVRLVTFGFVLLNAKAVRKQSEMGCVRLKHLGGSGVLSALFVR